MKISVLGYTWDASQNSVRIAQSWALQRHNVQMVDFKTPNVVEKILKHRPEFCLVTMGRDFDHTPLKMLRDAGIFLVQWIPDEYGPEDAPGGLWFEKIKGIYHLLMCETRGIVPLLKDYADDVIWIPMFFDQRFHMSRVERGKKFSQELVFMGGLNEAQSTIREDFLTKLQIGYSIRWCGARRIIVGGTMADIYVQSKIALNFINDKLPQYELGTSNRIFKAVGSGCFLLTQEIESMEELLIPGEHCATYSPMDYCDLTDKIDFFLKNERQREEIAARGRQHVLENFNIDKITAGFIDEIQKRMT